MHTYIYYLYFNETYNNASLWLFKSSSLFFIPLPSSSCLSSTSSDNTPLTFPTSYQWCQMESF